MRALNSDSSAEDKLKAAKSAIAGHLAGLKSFSPNYPEILTRMLQDILDDKWDDFVLLEDGDQSEVDGLKKALGDAIEAIKAL